MIYDIALVSMVNFTEPATINASSEECPASFFQNSTYQDNPGEFSWSADIQSFLLGAFFYGYVISQFPGGLLSERFGSHLIFGLSILVPGILTVLMPFIARWSPYVLGAVRILSGCAMGPLYPSFYCLMSRWAPPFERIKLMGIAVSGAQIGSVIAFALSGYLCNLAFLEGWPLVFYLFGGLGVIWFLFWWPLASDTPAADATISTVELFYIEAATKSLDSVKYHRPPFGAILKSGPVWVLLIMMITDSFGYYTVFNCAPLYMKQVLKYDIREDGVMICIPYLVSFALILIVSPLVDFVTLRKFLNLTITRKIFNFIGEGIQGFALIGIGLAGCNHMAAMALMIFCTAVSAFGLGGFSTNHIDIAPTYAGTLMGLTNGVSNMAGFIAPVIVAKLTGNSGNRKEWQHVFFLMGGLLVLGTLIYTIFGTAEEQKWSIEGREMNRKPETMQNTPCPSLESSGNCTQSLEQA